MPKKPARTFREAMQAQKCAITAELTLKRESVADDVLRQAELLGPWVDGIQVSDSPWAWTQMSAVAAAALLLEAGVDPVPIVTCRDRNRIALSSDLLGLHALGVRSMLLIRGHRLSKEHPLQAKAVLDLKGRELIALARTLEEDRIGGAGGKLFIGTGGKAFIPKPSWTGDSLKARAAAGAEFLQTQLCFNPALLRKYLQALVERKLTWSYQVVVSLAALPSAVTARWLKQHLADSKIPEDIFRRLQSAKDQEQEGVDICAELMRTISAIPGVSGINLMTTGNPEALVAAIKASGLRDKAQL